MPRSILTTVCIGLPVSVPLAAKSAEEQHEVRFDCNETDTSTRDWSDEKATWCCDHHGTGCPIPEGMEEFDCDAGFSNWKNGWSKTKKVWCCENHNKACPFDCHSAYNNWEAAWSDQKKLWCCENKGRGCPKEDRVEPYDCQVGYWNRAHWSQEQKDWCCLNKQLGCFFPTTTKATTETSSTTTSSATATNTSTTQAPATTTLTTASASAPPASASSSTSAPLTSSSTSAPLTTTPTSSPDATPATSTTALSTGASTTAPTPSQTVATSASTTATSSATTSSAAGTSKAATTARGQTVVPETTAVSTTASLARGGAHGDLPTPRPCFESEITWEPLDMPGTFPTHDADATACQKRCANTRGCTHFSYWWIGKNCHLQDAYSARQSGRLGFVSGPFKCWEDLDHTKYVNKGENTFVLGHFNCIELSTLYTPILGLTKTFAKWQYPTALDAINACRHYCTQVDGCAHFTVQFPHRLCRLAGAGAHALHPYINAASGNTTCYNGTEHSDSSGVADVIIRDALPQGLRPRRQPVLPSMPMAATSALLAGAAVLVAGLVRQRARWSALPRAQTAGAVEPSVAYNAVAGGVGVE